jgi:DNA-binding transcriptional LysR family regulator
VLKLSQLQILAAIAQSQNFSEAALNLGMSQSAVSHAIAALESELGVSLVSRGRYGARLTPVGERIVGHAQQLLQLSKTIQQEANLAKGLQGGMLRIAAFRSVATHVLPDIVAQFRQQYPAIGLQIIEYNDCTGVEEDLYQERVDIGFISSPTTHRLPTHEQLASTEPALDPALKNFFSHAIQDFETWELLRDEYIALFPPSFDGGGATLSWQQLTHYPLIMAMDEDSCDRHVYAHCSTFDVSLQAAYHFSADSTIVSMVARGVGVTIIPSLAAEPIPQGVKIYSLPQPLYRIIWVAMLANKLQTPPVFAFLDIVKAYIAKSALVKSS